MCPISLYILLTLLRSSACCAVLVGVLDRRLCQVSQPRSRPRPDRGARHRARGRGALPGSLPRPHLHLAERHLARRARVVPACCGVDPDADQHWQHLRACRCSASRWSASSRLFAFGRLQQHLPLSLGFAGRCPADGAWNTAVSFTTNTNWQWYSGEAAAGHLFQMSGLTVQNFVSASRRPWSVAAAFARGLARDLQDGRVGNFWTDLVRTVVRVLLPIAVVARGRAGCSSASCRTSSSPQAVHTLTGGTQDVTGGPVASQEAIKELGTNGGGFYNANSSHPFENPTPLTEPRSRSSCSS